LHMAQLMPLPLTASCFSKIQMVLPFWCRLTRIVPDKGPLNGCVCVYVVSGGPASDPGRLSSSDVTVNVTVLASNNPYGVYIFANDSQRASIAEDSDSRIVSRSSDQSADVTASLLVERTPGAADYIHVIFYSDYYHLQHCRHFCLLAEIVCLLAL